MYAFARNNKVDETVDDTDERRCSLPKAYILSLTLSCALGQFAGIDPAMEPNNVGISHSTAWIDDDGLLLELFLLVASNGANDAIHMEINDNTCGSILSPKEVVVATDPPCSKMAIR